MTKRLLLVLFCTAGIVFALQAQNIRGHYVSKAEPDGVIYHTFPCTLFENRDAGDLTYDITYKEHRDGYAVINFTYEMEQATPADSVRFTTGRTVMAGPVEKLYLEPGKKRWRHRYSFRTPVAPLRTFYDEATLPEVTVYSGGRAYVYGVKRAAWRSYAPVGYKIFEMIRVNEEH